jgi:hypothetical protein
MYTQAVLFFGHVDEVGERLGGDVLSDVLHADGEDFYYWARGGDGEALRPLLD